MPAKMIVKSGYIKNMQHAMNALEYAGNKIEAQLAVLEDGTVKELGAADRLPDDASVAEIHITLSNGKVKKLKPQRYRDYVRESSTLEQEQVIVWEGGSKKFNAADYIQYIAYRPSVEKAVDRKHGLFTLDGDADIELEKQKLLQCDDCLMWSHIISLERSDAERTGYDNRSAWRNLVLAKQMEIALIYNIDPKHLVVNAAYHDKDHHPHLHLYFYSTDRREGIVKDMTYASQQLKSLFFNEIFRGDVSYLKELHADQRGQLEARLSEILYSMGKQSYKPPKEVCDRLLVLSAALQDYKGKNVYAYHKPEIKAQVDELVECMISKDKHLLRLFSAYSDTQREFVEQYNDNPDRIEWRMEDFYQRFFHPRTGKSGRPGASDRAVLHNQVLRFARTFSDAVLVSGAGGAAGEQTVKKEIPATQRTAQAQVSELLPTKNPPRHPAGATEKKKRERSPEMQALPKLEIVLAKPSSKPYNIRYKRKQNQTHVPKPVKDAKLQFRLRYTATLMLRTCARELEKMARENDMYNQQGGGKEQQNNITDRRDPFEVWRNYTEPEPISQ